MARAGKRVHANKDFVLYGGAELAPMSTASDFKVAVNYATCREGCLLLKIVVDSALEHRSRPGMAERVPRRARGAIPPTDIPEVHAAAPGAEVRPVSGEHLGASAQHVCVRVMPSQS